MEGHISTYLSSLEESGGTSGMNEGININKRGPNIVVDIDVAVATCHIFKWKKYCTESLIHWALQTQVQVHWHNTYHLKVIFKFIALE